MSGPGLKHVDSHAAIHEAALNEARELNELMVKLLQEGESNKALEVAYVAIEHWETRTLRHAAAEEEGLYLELLEEHPELKDNIVALIRDHNTMRYFVEKIKRALEQDGITEEVLQLFHGLVQVDAYHNLEEERILPDH